MDQLQPLAFGTLACFGVLGYGSGSYGSQELLLSLLPTAVLYFGAKWIQDKFKSYNAIAFVPAVTLIAAQYSTMGKVTAIPVVAGIAYWLGVTAGLSFRS